MRSIAFFLSFLRLGVPMVLMFSACLQDSSSLMNTSREYSGWPSFNFVCKNVLYAKYPPEYMDDKKRDMDDLETPASLATYHNCGCIVLPSRISGQRRSIVMRIALSAKNIFILDCILCSLNILLIALRFQSASSCSSEYISILRESKARISPTNTPAD